MNETTAKLLEQLSAKLGTTSEYLWSVLLKQAPIDATITLVQTIMVIIAGIAIFKFHVHLSNDDNELSHYESEALAGLMFVLAIVWIIFAIACFFCMEDIVNGYFNPEYWALNKILSALKTN